MVISSSPPARGTSTDSARPAGPRRAYSLGAVSPPTPDAFVLEGLRSPEVHRRIDAIRRVGASGLDDPAIDAALLDALEDPGVYAYRERDWGDLDDDHAMRTVTVHVAEVTVATLGLPKRRARSVASIEARLAARAPEVVAPLYDALGALAPESTPFLLRSLAHADLDVRRAALRALGRAVFFSAPPQRLEIVRRAVEGLGDPSLGDAWRELLDCKHALFASPGQDAMRAVVRSDGPDVETLARWLASDARSVREVALSMLACRADDARARDLLAARIVTDLPRVDASSAGLRGQGARQCAEVELAVHILCHEQTLTALCADTRVRDALRAYALRGLQGPGDPWFVVLAVARQLADDPQLASVVLARLEAPDPAPELGPLPGLFVAQVRVAGPRRDELLRRGVLALLSPDHAAREGSALRALASIDGAVFTATVLPRLEGSEPFDRDAWLIAEGLDAAGPAGAAALPALERLAARTLGSSPIKRAIKTLAAKG